MSTRRQQGAAFAIRVRKATHLRRRLERGGIGKQGVYSSTVLQGL